MKSILHLKFIALYIIFGFLCVFTTAMLAEELIQNQLEEDTSRTLYREATLIASDYLHSSLWFVSSDGTMITSSNLEGTSSPEAIEDFDPAEIGGSQYITGTYHGYFDEDMITVMAPVTEGFSTSGYLLIHSPLSAIEENCSEIMVSVYICLGVIFLLSFIFLLGFQFFVYNLRSGEAVRLRQPGL